jgi:subtilisin family serine protease
MYQVLGDYCLVYNMEKEYTVIANTREDLPALEAEITASSGAGPIPNRRVDIANPRPGSRIQTHFMLTDAEAEELRKDPRVRAVEIPPEQRDDIQIGIHANQNDNFYRGSNTSSEYVNWGLRRVIETTNTYGTDTTVVGPYQYALDGTGVDVVIQDSGIDANHPDWLASDGVTSRLQQIDWYTESGLSGTQDANFYTDYDGHGTHCASISAGIKYGWAKGAHIYAQKLSGLEGANDPNIGISMTDAFDTIRLWHNAKTNGRPTVVNMSWGYSATITTDPDSGVYRGTPWTWGVDYTDRNVLFAATGVSINAFYNSSTQTYYFRIPVRVASVDAEIEDMIADGLHVCIAAGNNFHKADLPDGDDYDNTVVFSGVTRNYHRGSSPYSNNAFMVGNINSSTVGGTDRTSASSTRGPGVNIWAPGTDIHAACSTNSYRIGQSYVTQHPDDPNFYIMRISGTSMASPQVAGLCALHLQVKPNLTPAQLKDRIINDSTEETFTTGSDTDYNDIYYTLLGSPNRFMYSRYGKQPVVVNNTTIITEMGFS